MSTKMFSNYSPHNMCKPPATRHAVLWNSAATHENCYSRYPLIKTWESTMINQGDTNRFALEVKSRPQRFYCPVGNLLLVHLRGTSHQNRLF